MVQVQHRPTTPQHLEPSSAAYDSRFRQLVPREAWGTLRPAIQRRFSKRLQGNHVALYAGEIIATKRNFAGRVLAGLCRIIGAPLPLYDDANVPAVVVVSEDRATGGQRWTRIYHRRQGNPQLINSAKAFAGSTGLEEWIGGGFGMALTVEADEDRLRFRSKQYFFALSGHRFILPKWITPGETLVTHRDLGEGRFAFDLELRHPFLGLLVVQHAIFRDQ